MTKQERTQWKRRARIALIPIALFAGAGIYHLSHGGPDLVAFRDVKSDLPRFSFDAGSVYSYAVDWKVDQQNRVLSPQKTGANTESQVEGKLALKGKVELVSYGKRDDVFVLGLRVHAVEELRWTVLGQQVVKDAGAGKAFEGREAFFELTPSGKITRTHFRDSASAEWKSFAQWLITELEFELPTEAQDWERGEWFAEESTALGRTQSEYKRVGVEGLHLARTRPYFVELVGADVRATVQEGKEGATADLSEAGHLTQLVTQGNWALSDGNGPSVKYDKRLALTLLSVRRDKPKSLPNFKSDYAAFNVGDSPGQVSSSEEALRNRVGNMNVGEMVSDVLAFANGGRMDHQWMWQATGLLEMHPEATRELEEAYAHPELTTQGKGLVLDLLASVGHDQAQASLRKLVDTRVEGESDEDHAVLFNRVSLLSSANRETAQFVEEKFEEHAGEDMTPMRIASTYALGAVANRQAEGGDKAGALELNQKLEEALSGAKDSKDKELALRAMGNAGLEENVGTLVEHTKSKAGSERAAAADALRKNHTDESVTALLELLKDPEWRVQQAALSSLTYYKLTVQESQRVEGYVVAGVVSPQNDPLLVNVLAKNATPEHPFAAGFVLILQRNQENGQLAARIRAIGRRNGVTL